MNDILITTVVSLDCQAGYNQRVIHLVVGDYGARALRLVPIDNGSLMNMSSFSTAKVLMACEGHEDLLIDCTLGENYATLVPTAAMVSTADEWNCQLQLTNRYNGTVKSAPFTINVHGTVYEGDAVEHTDNRVVKAYFYTNGNLRLELSSGALVESSGLANLEAYIEYTLDQANKLITAADRTALDGVSGYLNQDVRTTASPTFAGATIGGVTIDDEGNITGARFT